MLVVFDINTAPNRYADNGKNTTNYIALYIDFLPIM